MYLHKIGKCMHEMYQAYLHVYPLLRYRHRVCRRASCPGREARCLGHLAPSHFENSRLGLARTDRRVCHGPVKDKRARKKGHVADSHFRPSDAEAKEREPCPNVPVSHYHFINMMIVIIVSFIIILHYQHIIRSALFFFFFFLLLLLLLLFRTFVRRRSAWLAAARRGEGARPL